MLSGWIDYPSEPQHTAYTLYMYVVSEQTLGITDVYGSFFLLQGPLGAAGAEGRQGEKGAKVTVISFFGE